MAAKTEVVVVPILEPRDSGYARSMLMTPIPMCVHGSLVNKHVQIHLVPYSVLIKKKRLGLDGWMNN